MPASGRSRRAWGWHRLDDEWAARVLRLLLKAGPRLTAADLVLQRAVVRKYTGQQTPRTHRMSAGLTVPRRAFRPPPRVDSAVLLVRRR